MPGRYRVTDEGKLVIERWEGIVGHRELTGHLWTRVHDPDVAAGASVLLDIRQATFPESDLDRIRGLAAVYGDPSARGRIVRVAMVVALNAPVHVRVHAGEARQYGVTIMTFDTVAIACAWLGVDPEAVTRELEALTLEGGSPQWIPG